MNIIPFTAKAAAALLLAQCLMSAGTSAANAAGAAAATTSVKQNVSINTAAALKNMVFSQKWTASAPSSLQSFTQDVVSELSRQDAFEKWKNASISYDPLGPGTHSWLATVSQNGKPIGYLILTSTDDGNYMLSEYGRDDEMPYNTQALYNRLKQLGILKVGAKLPAGLSIEAQYAALLPVWKVSQPGKNTVYIHGITAEELPIDAPDRNSVSGGLTPHQGIRLSTTSLPEQQRTSNPYDNLLWLSSPKLPVKGNSDLIQAFKAEHNSLVFTSPGHNANYGAPFAITGLHSWSTAGKESVVLYAASGIHGSRYLPTSSLLSLGEFRILNLSHI
ncbi:hypothetical protein MUG84_01470 [Paenibacillus sp. KQZ6P-2]|uniref:Uncharacterized protein n=1 Tax=Paenibacillus mangrovi TaxID=2931978 RepID=A0A9X2B104_9BACL|nr:hypothetical protein [Paenibacillus mangrovi]MCJ8010410.1 hypothetical protein [Paenibacillus mangrovi]